MLERRDETKIDELRNQLARLKSRVGADFVVGLTFQSDGDIVVVRDVIKDGDARNWPLLKDSIPPAGFDHDASDDAIGMRSGQWTLQAPDRSQRNRFSWLEDDIGQPTVWNRTSAYQSLYQPNGIERQLRAIFSLNTTSIVGWVAFQWKTDVDRRDAIANELGAESEALRDAFVQLRPPTRQRSHRLLFANDGELIGQTEGAIEALGDEGLRLARSRVLREPLNDEIVRYLHGYRVTRVRMRVAHGEGDLLLLDPLKRLDFDRSTALTQRQREVAIHVAAGHTNGETAERLDISNNTVKYHLKKIFELLQIERRDELVRFVEIPDHL